MNKSLMHNPFVAKDEIIFIEYEEIIRSPYPLLLNLIAHQYRDSYKDFLWMEEFESMDMKNLERLCVQRTKKNIFEYLAKTPFDYDKALKEFKDKFFNLYNESPMLAIGENIAKFMTQKFTKQIYIHTEEYDTRVHLDIQETFNNMELVNYVTGPFDDVIQTLDGISCYILRDIEKVPVIFDHQKGNYTEILLAAYGFNYKLDEKEDPVYKIDIQPFLTDETVFKFGTFQPVELTAEHFTFVVEG